MIPAGVADPDPAWVLDGGADEASPPTETGFEPPPTRTSSRPAADYRVAVDPVPEVPESGLWASVRYLIAFARARWQRRGAIGTLREQIAADTSALDGVLGNLGREVRALGVTNRTLAAENEAIDDAERRKQRAEHDSAEIATRQAEENAKFAEIEQDRESKVAEAESALEKEEQELGSLEAQRRGLRDKRKEIERRQRGYVKAAEEREEKAAKSAMGDDRIALRKDAENLRREAATLDPERQDIERRVSALERPITLASAKVESLRGALDSSRASLNDAREGHRHRGAELEAEQGKKSRELAQADAEILRRLLTLGTLVNLNRIDRPDLAEIYGRIDNLRSAIGARANEIDRMTAERDAYDRSALIRGGVVLGAAFVALLTVIALLLWMI